MGQRLKTTSCSSRIPQVDYHHPHDGLQVSVTPAPGDLTFSSGLRGHLHTWRHTLTQTHVNENITISKELKMESCNTVSGYITRVTVEGIRSMPMCL